MQEMNDVKVTGSTLKEVAKDINVEIEPFFTQDEISELARESGFVKREGKIDGNTFLNLIVFNSDNLNNQSLNDLSGILQDDYWIDICTQSLNERFNKYAIIFLKNVLEETIKRQIQFKQLPYTELKIFSRILIKDSTSFQIDKSLAEHYPGSGGSGSKASIRIQFEYDILSGEINDLSINAFNDQDSKNSIATLELTEEGDLIIRDLAYMSLEALEAIEKSYRYFLCRANTNTYLYEIENLEFKKMDFAKITKYMNKNNIQMLEKEAYLGGDKLKVRLILHLLPAEKIAKRLRNAIKNNVKKGGDGNLSAEHKAKIALNLFITNAEVELIPTKNVWYLYRLRWQVELIFKIWKSICNIEKVKKVKIYRLECYIYSKLLIIVFGWQLLWKIATELFYKECKALSFMKAFKTLIGRKIEELRKIFCSENGLTNTFMMEFYNLSRTHHLLEKRKEEPTYIEILTICLSV